MKINHLKHHIEKNIKDKTFRSGILFTLFSFLNNGISFILLLILARFITPDEYGKLNLFNTFILIASIFISLSSNGYITVCFFNKSSSDFKKILNSVFLITSIVFILFLSFQLIFSDFFRHSIGLQNKYQLIALLICYCQVFNTVNLDIWRLEEKPILYGLYSSSVAVLNFALTLILVISFHQGWLGRLNAQLIVAIIYFIISVIFLIKRKFLVFTRPTRKLFSETLLFGLPLVPHLASGWIRQGLDRYFVNHYHSISDVGIYSFAFNFANIILIIGMAFNASNSVFIFKNLADNSIKAKEKLINQTRFMIIFFVALSIIVLLSAHIFISYVTPQYQKSQVYLLPLFISSFFQSIYLLFVNYLFFYQKTKILMYITFSVSILHMISSYFLTKYSIIFTAYTSVISSFLIFIFVYFAARHILKELKIDKEPQITLG